MFFVYLAAFQMGVIVGVAFYRRINEQYIQKETKVARAN